LVANGVTSFTRLGVGADGKVLRVSGGVPGWGSVAAGDLPVPFVLTGNVASAVLGGVNSGTALGSTGIAGSAIGNSGITFGVYGENQSSNGRAIYGNAVHPTGTTYALYGFNQSSNGTGLFAEANSATGMTYGVYGQSSSNVGTGVYGNAPAGNGANFGGQFSSASIGGTGLLGSSTATTGNTVAGRFENASSSGIAVSGQSSATTGNTFGAKFINSSSSGKAVYGFVNAATGTTFGGWFESSADAGTGILGKATSNIGIVAGVHGQTASPTGYGVRGSALGSTTGLGAGVFGESIGENRPGVLGVSNLTGGVWAYAMQAESREASNIRNVGIEARAEYGTYNYGVKATATAFSGTFAFAVDALSTDFIAVSALGSQPIVANGLSVSPGNKVVNASNSIGTAVYGRIFASNVLDYGVYGEVQTGYGVYSDGDMGATGVKSFVIDHPFDPENKYLKHFCTEGPVPMNAYSGNVTTDAEGNAWVELPNYFEEVNTNFRYQLTCIGTFASAIVGAEIQENRFQIRTDKPKVKVSWRVEADRNDRWVQEHPVSAEVQKPEFQRGTYMRPELFGQPRERKTTYDAQAEAVRKFQIESISAQQGRGKSVRNPGKR
jgi:hypothetical protein